MDFSKIEEGHPHPMKIERPSCVDLDCTLGEPMQVLDHGWVRTIDYMGDDAAIVQAARVSYGKGTKSVSQDEGLIRYLMRHWHSTPFEMCLSGDTKVPHFSPDGVTVKTYTMKELSDAFEQGGKENSWVKLLKIRTVNPKTGVVTATKIKRAWKTGMKKVYRIVTEQPFGRSITLTNNHPILTPKGFRSIEDGLSVGDEIMHTRSRLEKAVPAKIVSITCVGVQPVYDLEVEDPNHTFVAEGIVVHNCELKLHVKLPIFVARQWIRHRTANVNEMSARYSILDNEFYIPAPHDLAAQSQVNNQGRGTVLTGNEAQTVLDMLRDEAARSYSTYEELMREDPEAGKLGLARELARMNLPTNIYTQWYWKVDLHNLFHFLRLRADAHAQFEIRAYAEVICDIVKSWVPLAYRAFEDYRMNAVTLSSMEIEALREYFAACQPDREHDGWPEPKGLSERESGEFFRKLGLMK